MSGTLRPVNSARRVLDRLQSDPRAGASTAEHSDEPGPKVSVIIATYCSGTGIDRVVASLDAQSMPQDQFEVILVDDGSPDNTVEHLMGIARTRPNYRVFRIENSGWPSKPRNLGIDNARGEYLTFMDHDDSLYPDALRSAYEYAHQTGADIVHTKESKTNDPFWQTSPQVRGNLPNFVKDPGIKQLLPLMPHKFYARHLFTKHHIRFPEGGRVLWEDQFLNVEAFKHSKVVAFEAQTPFYLWHASDTNTSHTFQATRQEFWDRLTDIIEFIDKTLTGSRNADARKFMMLHQLGSRVIDRAVTVIERSSGPEAELAGRNSQALLQRYLSAGFRRSLSRRQQIQAHLIGAGRFDLARDFQRFDRSMSASAEAVDVEWVRGGLQLTIDARLAGKEEATGLRRDGDRVVLGVPAEIRSVVPPELLDVTDAANSVACRVVIRSRGDSYLSWPVFLDKTGGMFDISGNRVAVMWRGTGKLRLDDAAAGSPLQDAVYDFYSHVSFMGIARKPKLAYTGPVSPAVIAGRPAVAYPSASSTLALDLAQETRTLPIDARPVRGPAGTRAAVSARLTRVRVDGRHELEAGNILALPADRLAAGADPSKLHREQSAASQGLALHIATDGASARLQGSVNLPPATYRLYAVRAGQLHQTTRMLQIQDDGAVVLI